MNNSVTNCPKCASYDISFDISLGKLKCNYCGHIIENKIYDDSNNNVTNNEIQSNDNTYNTTSVEVSVGAGLINDEHVKKILLKCSQCGETYFSGESNNYSKCFLCGSELSICGEYIMEENGAKILPFTVSKEEALASLNTTLKSQFKFSEKEFKNNFNSNNLYGVYLPYKIINSNYNCNFSGQGEREIDYHRDSDDNGASYTVDLYDVERQFNIDAKGIMLDYKDEHINDTNSVVSNIITAAGPFDINESVDLDGRHLKGYNAQIINHTDLQLDDTLKNKLISVAKYGILNDINMYDRGVRWDKTEIIGNKIDYYYVYLPLWVYIYTKEKNNVKEYYYVAVNGRTKEIVSHVPFNKFAGIKEGIKAALIVMLVLSLIYVPIVIMYQNTEFLSTAGSISAIVVPIVIVAFSIFAFFHRFKQVRKICNGLNEINENDNLVTKEISKINFSDNKVKTFRTSKSCIKNENDYSDKIRLQKFMKNVKVIKK